MKATLTITLQSELLTSDGDSHNSSVDLDVCYDEFGLVYIPGKRIKGLIKEAALDVGVTYHGAAAESDTNFFVSDAKLDNYDDIVYQLKHNEAYQSITQQDVLKHFTSKRTQTSINEDGTIKTNSLRTMRTINSGLIFNSRLEVEPSQIESTKADFKKITKAIRHIGTNRTRGQGFVKCEIEFDDTSENPNKALNLTQSPNDSCKKIYQLDYSLTLNTPAIMINGNGNRSVSEDYIEGSKMLGAFIRAYSKKDSNANAMKLIDDNLIFSNLYISHQDKRCEPIMASMVKNKADLINNSTTKLFNLVKNNNTTDNESRKSRLNYYFDGDYQKGYLKLLSVKKFISYHHRRSDDKRKTIDDVSSAFYQLESIAKNQIFKGFIRGTKQQIDAFKSAFNNDKSTKNNNNILKIGYSKSTEFGECQLKYHVQPDSPEQIIVNQTDEVIGQHNIVYYLHALSPLILYNKDFMVSTDVKELEAYLPIKVINVDKNHDAYVNHKAIGGYNVTWRTIKPTILVIDKGSVVPIRITKGHTIPKHGFVGERNTEGFGEYKLYKYDDLISPLAKTDANEDQPIKSLSKINTHSLNALDAILLTKIKTELLTHADIKPLHLAGINSTTTHTMIKSIKHAVSIADFYNEIFEITNTMKRRALLKLFFKNIDNIQIIKNNNSNSNRIAKKLNKEINKQSKIKILLENIFKGHKLNDKDIDKLALDYYLHLFTLYKLHLRTSQ